MAVQTPFRNPVWFAYVFFSPTESPNESEWWVRRAWRWSLFGAVWLLPATVWQSTDSGRAATKDSYCPVDVPLLMASTKATAGAILVAGSGIFAGFALGGSPLMTIAVAGMTTALTASLFVTCLAALETAAEETSDR